MIKEGSITPSLPVVIADGVVCCHQEPGDYRAVDDAHVLSATPGFVKGYGRDVFRLMR